MYCSTCLPQHPALGVPEHQAGRFLLHVEEIELRAEAPVVALLGLLQHLEVRVLVLLLPPGRAVDALEHLVLRIAAPVRARDAHQLEHLELAGRGHVRPAAEIDPVALAVQRDRFLLGNGSDDLGLVLLALVAEERHRFVARHFLALNRQILLRDFRHPFFDGGEILGRERPLVREVVVEAVLDHRPDGHLRLREELLHRMRQQVRGGVAQDLDAFGIAFRDDGDFGIGVDAVARVDELAVHLAGERGAREPGADGAVRFRRR